MENRYIGCLPDFRLIYMEGVFFHKNRKIIYQYHAIYLKYGITYLNHITNIYCLYRQ
ncbi:hypothetical protein GFK82_00758 [Candidatus Steffania adelgidicola]|nr:hypothetical protein GFK82_00758 [Candidatus Steffania adelgidicola]